MLSLYRALTELRRAEPALHSGAYRSVDAENDDLFAYVRSAPGGDSFLIVLNFSNKAHTVDLSDVAGSVAHVAITTGMDRAGKIGPSRLMLDPNEGLVLRLG